MFFVPCFVLRNKLVTYCTAIWFWDHFFVIGFHSVVNQNTNIVLLHTSVPTLIIFQLIKGLKLALLVRKVVSSRSYQS